MLAPREADIGDRLPYVGHLDDVTLQTRDGLLVQTLHLQGFPSETAPDPTRSSAGSLPPIAQTASTPGKATVSPSSAPRQPSARGLEAWIQALQSHVKGDVDTAGVEAKRQIDELKSKTMRSLDEMRRVWNNATHVFSDKDANQVHAEVAAKPR